MSDSDPDIDPENPRALKVRVYVAGASKEAERVRETMNGVRAHPYLQLTHDWLKAIEAWGRPDSELTDEDALAHAQKDLQAIHDADIVWYLEPKMAPSAGAAFELGAAWGLSSQWSMPGKYIGHSRTLLLSGQGRYSIFHALADERFATDEQALAWLCETAEYLVKC